MIFYKNTVFHMSSYLSQASGALVLVITVIADNKPLELCYLCLITYFLMPIILKYIDIR